MALIKQVCRLCGKVFGEINCPLAKEGETTGGYCQDCFEKNLRRFNLAPPQPKTPQLEEK